MLGRGLVRGSSSDPDWVKLRNIADYLDDDDDLHGYDTDNSVQNSLREMANRLEKHQCLATQSTVQ